MSLADELLKLEQLHQRNTLTDAEFVRSKMRLLESPVPIGMAAARLNGFRRSRADRWLGGVCGGLAVSTGVDSWIWRLLFALMLFAGGTGLVVYLLLWVFVPGE